MKKVKLFISFLLFLLFTSSQVKAGEASKAQDIPMYRKSAHLGTRTAEPSIAASLEQNQLTVDVSRYIGIVNVYIYDANGNLMLSSSGIQEGYGSFSLDLSALEKGSNNVIVELENIVYWGILEM